VDETKQQVEQLKFILENIRSPERLDDHPWTSSLAVQEKVSRDSSLVNKGPGLQLVMTLANLFRQMMPNTPPQSGKRLDTRWGRFGILAANYFAPLLFGRIYPRSLREAWRRIDQAILLFVFGKPANELKPEQVSMYQLVGEELDLPANSTISDWHRSGLQDLADLFANQEKHLGLALVETSSLLNAKAGNQPEVQTEPPIDQKSSFRAHVKIRRWFTYSILAVLLLGAIFLGNKGLQLARLAQTVRQDIVSLEQLNPTALDSDAIDQASSLLDKAQADVKLLHDQATPWLGLADRLGWVPVYGGDLASAGDLLDMAYELTTSAQQTLQTVYPIWQAIKQPGREIKASELTGMLLNTRSSLEVAQSSLQRAISARHQINPALLTPDVNKLVLRVDPYLSLLDEALSMALSVPNLLGATEEGPKTYLILVQNEDELRPTGGFITAVAKVVVAQGEMINFSVEDSYAVDDSTKTYPLAPWQLRSFMNIPVLVFRDANWYTDYPTTVIWTEYLYAFTNSFSADGIIAIDQHVLDSILTVIGPIYVQELDITVNAENVREVMRAQKNPPPEAERDPDWHRKQFMKPISSAILDRMFSGKGISWEAVLRALMTDLDEHHILIQLDDPTLTTLLAERGWDGAVRREAGDFLMVVDSNVGYNKTNAVVKSSLIYDVDLTDISSPVTNLTVIHQNNARGQIGASCTIPVSLLDKSLQEPWYPIDRCYYDYLRVYVPAGTQLVSATPHAVTRQEMIMLEQDIPARVDLLNEIIENVTGFGTLLVTPIGQSLNTTFQFKLPTDVLQSGSDANEKIYRLKIQKQAGIVVIPVTLRIHLPANAKISAVTPNGIVDGRNVFFELDLREDIVIEITFRQ
jgi:hypothetical protein